MVEDEEKIAGERNQNVARVSLFPGAGLREIAAGDHPGTRCRLGFSPWRQEWVDQLQPGRPETICLMMSQSKPSGPSSAIEAMFCVVIVRPQFFRGGFR